LILAVIFMLLFCYILTYGQVKDWYESPEIIICTVFCLLSLSLLLSRTFIIANPFLDLKAFQYPNVIFGLLIMLILGLFFAASNLQTAMLNIILKNDSIEITRINLYLIPGYIVATIAGYLYFKKYNGFKTAIIVVSACYTISFMLLYFLTSLSTTSSDFYLPMFFRGTAILLSYMAIGIYVADGVPFAQFFSVVFYYLTIRTFLGPVIWSSFLSNFYYRRTIHNVHLLASKIDLADTFQQAGFKPAYNAAIRQGDGPDQATNVAIRAMFNSVQTQASLLALKETFGLIIIAGLLLIILLFITRIYRHRDLPDEQGFVLP
jgi:DHA2 family multidrug resistance protein